MAENKPDFSKIWASNSPLPDYSFSDSNYQRGWDFIGSQPPARTMFDALQKQNDLKFQYLNSNQWLIIQRNKTYALDDIAYSPKLPSWAFLECTSPGTTADIEPSFAGVAVSDTITDGSVEWTVRKLGTSSGANIGDIKWSSVDLTQVGWLVATGAEVGRDTYPDLNEYYASRGYPWGAGDGSTTFNLPNLIGKFAEGALSAGGYKEAGLPNITGRISSNGNAEPLFMPNTITSIGALNVDDSTSTGGPGGSASQSSYQALNFDASHSNLIYGNSDTVQPPSALLIPYVKAFKGASAESTDLEISKVANDVVRLSGRVHLVDSKVNEDGSWYRQYSDGWVEQGGISAYNQPDVNITVNLLKPYANEKYSIAFSYQDNVSGTAGTTYGIAIRNITTTKFDYQGPNGYTGRTIRWSCAGQGATV